MSDWRKLGERSFGSVVGRTFWARPAARGLVVLTLGFGGVVACGSADDSGLTGSEAGGAAGSASGGAGGASCAGLSCYDACLCAGGEPTPCVDQCSGAGGSGAGGSGAGGSGAQGGSGAGGSGAGGSGHSCDPVQCPSTQGGFVKGCCAASDRCGFDLSGLVQGGGCVESNQPGTRDDDCPATNISGQVIPGCCRADKTCGFLDSFLGLGCVSPTDFGAPPGGSCEAD